MQFLAIGEALDRTDLLALRLNGKHQTGPHRLVIENDRACAADPMFAADMGAGLPAIVADRVDQRFARLDPDRIIAAVDVQYDVEFFVHGHFQEIQRGSTSENFLRTRSSTSLLARTTSGKLSRRLNGLQASITTRALRGSSAA